LYWIVNFFQIENIYQIFLLLPFSMYFLIFAQKKTAPETEHHLLLQQSLLPVT